MSVKAAVRGGKPGYVIASAALVVGALVVGALSAPAGAAARSAGAASALSPNPGSNNDLTAVSAISATNAWAVGRYSNSTTQVTDTLVVHWNGSKWSRVPSPDPSATTNELSAVSATSASNVWAVGDYTNNKSSAIDTLILHWNGKRWSQFSSANPGKNLSILSSVTATSGTNAWAVGIYCVKACGFNEGFNSLILHWNGTRWSRAAMKNPGPAGNGLSGVSATSAGSAWAAGYYINSATHNTDTLTEHWNGTAWSKATSPNAKSTYTSLSGVSALSAADAWTVGGYQITVPGTVDNWTEHWNGNAWSKVATPNPSSSINYLFAVAAITKTSIWAVGRYCASGCSGGSEVDKALILHSKGTTWSKVSSPNPSPTLTELNGVSGVSASNAWAVGDYCTTSACDTLILHWNGTSWSKA